MDPSYEESVEPELTKLIRFRLGELLIPEDPLSHWIANVALAINDLLLVRRRLRAGYRDEAPEIEHIYDMRMLSVHAWEFSKFLFESERASSEVRAFVASLPPDVVAEHERAIDAIYGDRDEAPRFKRQLASARDQVAHYSSLDHKLMRGALSRLSDLDAHVLVGGDFGDFRADFAASVDAQLFFPLDDDLQPFEEFSRQLNELVVVLLRFSRIAIDRFLLRHQGLLDVEQAPSPGGGSASPE